MLGSGTTFTLYFPSAGQAVVEAMAAPVVVPRGSETVLVVDDDHAVRRVIVRALERGGYQVWEAENGHVALALLGAEVDPPALLLSDLVMPGIGGKELVAEIVARGLPIRILLMSGYSRDRMSNAEWMEHMAFVEKPFTGDVLLRRVREVLDRSTPTSRPRTDAA